MKWMQGALAASLVLNGALAIGLFLKTVDTRAYYQQLWQDRNYRHTVRPEPASVALAEPPVQPERFEPQQLAALVPRHAYATQTGPALTAWRNSTQVAFARALNYEPAPGVPAVRVTERTTFPTFVREKVYLETATGIWLPAYVMVPKGPAVRRPAVLALPGHDGSLARGAQAIAGQDYPGNYMRSFGLRLAEAGYVVLAIDVAGIGELAAMGYQRLFTGGLLRGDPMVGFQLEQVHAATSYLASRPEVDPARLGTMGVSLGGELALFSAALDPRVGFAVVSGFFGSYRDYPAHVYPSMFPPGILRVVDLPDVAALVAPRPLLVQLGAQDTVVGIPIEVQRRHFAKVQGAYRAAGAPDATALEIHPDGHVMVVESALAWLKRVVPPTSARSSE